MEISSRLRVGDRPFFIRKGAGKRVAWPAGKRMARSSREVLAMFCVRPHLGMATPFGACVARSWRKPCEAFKREGPVQLPPMTPRGASSAKRTSARGQFNSERWRRGPLHLGPLVQAVRSLQARGASSIPTAGAEGLCISGFWRKQYEACKREGPVQFPALAPRAVAFRFPGASSAKLAGARGQFNPHRWRRESLHLGPLAHAVRSLREQCEACEREGPVQVPPLAPRAVAPLAPGASSAKLASARDQFDSHRWRRGPLHLVAQAVRSLRARRFSSTLNRKP